MTVVNVKDTFERHLKIALNDAMLKAAEPLIAAALVEVEREMRKAVAARLISLVDRTYSVDRNRDDLHIVVHQAFEKGGER